MLCRSIRRWDNFEECRNAVQNPASPFLRRIFSLCLCLAFSIVNFQGILLLLLFSLKGLHCSTFICCSFGVVGRILQCDFMTWHESLMMAAPLLFWTTPTGEWSVVGFRGLMIQIDVCIISCVVFFILPSVPASFHLIPHACRSKASPKTPKSAVSIYRTAQRDALILHFSTWRRRSRRTPSIGLRRERPLQVRDEPCGKIARANPQIDHYRRDYHSGTPSATQELRAEAQLAIACWFL